MTVARQSMQVLLTALLLMWPRCSARGEDLHAEPMLGTLSVAKILFLGNSITLHSPAPAIGWTGNWGMAASAPEKDYVHLLSDQISIATGQDPEVMVRNIAEFEREYRSFKIPESLKPELAFGANVVIVAIGENIREPSNGAERNELSTAIDRLLIELTKQGRPQIFVRSSFWPSLSKDGIMREASEKVGATFIDLSSIGRDPTHAARSERQIDHAGVGAHPGDKGMKAIADAIFASLCRTAKYQRPDRLIGYTEFRTNLAGGRHANTRTMRAKVVHSDGTRARQLASNLVDRSDAWTQFAGWSPDGKTAIVAQGWQSPENAQIEEQAQAFNFTEQGRSLDSHLVDITSGETVNVTGVQRVSFYNSGLFFWPRDPSKFGFTALIDGNSHPFSMGIDGRNKVDLTTGADAFTYGLNGSPDGNRIAYHKNYQIYLADADGTNAKHVQTGHPFNFGPTWSPDGDWILFVSGKHYDCHPHIVRADGSGLQKLADRGGYRGVTEFLDVPDFHGGSSDTPVWSADGERVFYTGKVDSNVELFAVDLAGNTEQLTKSAAGSLHYHPQPSPDGTWLLYGSKRNGVRQLYARSLTDSRENRITHLGAGQAAMWAHWQPTATTVNPLAARSSTKPLEKHDDDGR